MITILDNVAFAFSYVLGDQVLTTLALLFVFGIVLNIYTLLIKR
jgi:hypothetical protein